MTARKVSELPTVNSITSDCKLLVINDPSGVPNTVIVTQSNFFANTQVPIKFANTLTVSNTVILSANVTVRDFHISNTSTPANSSITAVEGKIWFDEDYIYVATANNTIKRAALSTF